ncbi:MAG: YidC/Oxa1 family membrane protein insertase [Oscillospiraceae bacterium]|nr:YidC/Oxa1 family membrane protein insertase [Oscillospiraceae bacterium]
MNFLFTLFAPLLGILMRGCYLLVQNTGVAIILFTIIIKIAMFPLSLKQQKSSAKTQIFMPKVRELQTKYRNNSQKMSEEMLKLQKQGYNPMGGCLPGLLTMLILFGVLGVVYKPMTYFEKIPGEQLDKVAEVAMGVELDEFLTIENDKIVLTNTENENNPEITNYEKVEPLTKESGEYKDREKTLTSQYGALQGELRIIGVYKNNPEKFRGVGITQDTLDTLDRLESRIVFLGIDFSRIPSTSEKPIFPLILIPILSFIFAALQTIIMQAIQKKTSPETAQQMGGMKYMFYFLPFLSLMIAFQFPAGAGFYWTISSILGIAQTLLIHVMFPPAKLREEVLSALEKQGHKFDNVIVIEKQDGKTTTKKASEMSSAERKEYFRKKLEEARKADLEKYGEIGNTPNDNNQEKED